MTVLDLLSFEVKIQYRRNHIRYRFLLLNNRMSFIYNFFKNIHKSEIKSFGKYDSKLYYNDNLMESTIKIRLEIL